MLLPNELVDYTISYLHDDRSSLQACSLVSRTFLVSCRRHLFRSICLRPHERKWDPDLRKDTIISFLSIAPYVTGIIVDWDDGDTSYPGENGVSFNILHAISLYQGAATLVSLSSITHRWLQLRNVPISATSRTAIATMLGNGRTSSVRELTFEHSTLPSIHILAEVASSCTTLEKLTLRYVSWPSMHASTSRSLPKLIRPLRTFGYHGSYNQTILFRWISCQDHLPLIDPLSLDISLEEVPFVSSLIANWGANLITLRIAFSHNAGALVRFSTCDCLHLAPVLQSLQVVLPYRMDIDSDDALVHLTRILTPSNLARSLRKLIIEFSFSLNEHHGVPSSKWTDLKDLLLGFAQLETIRIKSYMTIGDSSEKALRAALGPLQRRIEFS